MNTEAGRIAVRKYRANNLEKVREICREWHKQWKTNNPTSYKEYFRAKNLWYMYGMTAEQWQTMWDAQLHLCALCKRNPVRPETDHKGNVVRGILCTNCNTGLGKFQDNPELLRRAADYIEGKITSFLQTNGPQRGFREKRNKD